MSSPRKFAEKIALIQQKRAEGDAAFNTIIYEVEAAKQRGDRGYTGQSILDVPTRKHDKNFHDSNGNLEHNNNNGSDQLLQPPDNTWRRTHSDSSLHHGILPTVVANYHARLEHENNEQQFQYQTNEVKFDCPSYSVQQQYVSLQQQQAHYSLSNTHFQPSPHPFDLNNNHNYPNDQINPMYTITSAPTTPLAQQSFGSSPNHCTLGSRYSGGNGTSNVLMLPSNQHPRGGGSLPDLRTENTYHHHPPVSYSTLSSPPSSATQRLHRSSSPQQQTNDADLFNLNPQRQLPSSIGPLKSPSMRRRHSPIGEVKQSSPRRHNSPSPDVSTGNHQSGYRVEPSSPQSQSSYSPQNSPHFLPSPTANELNPFSPQSSAENQQGQTFCTLPNHFDRINLDANNVYPQPSTQSQQSHSNSTNSVMSNGTTANYYSQHDFFLPFMSEISTSYNPSQSSSSVSMNNPTSQKSPTIPNIILTGVDSSKLDLTNVFDNLIDPLELQLDTDDFLLTTADLSSVDPNNLCDDTFRLES